MAGVSTKEIKNRIRSMESTRQITRAMEMVASSKLRRAQTQAQNARPYYEALYDAIREVSAAAQGLDNPYLSAPKDRPRAWVVIAGDRGLAGGYNANVLKMAAAQMQTGDFVLPVGKKALEFFRSRPWEILPQARESAGELSPSHCYTLAKALCTLYLQGKLGAVEVVYTRFDSLLSQTPQARRLLPLEGTEAKPGGGVIFEPDPDTVLTAIVPEYLGGVLYGTLCESRASEQAARRTAMDSATKNATGMIDDLSLRFNRARQAAITQEITEIVAGS